MSWWGKEGQAPPHCAPKGMCQVLRTGSSVGGGMAFVSGLLAWEQRSVMRLNFSFQEKMFSVSLWVRGCASLLCKAEGLRVSNERRNKRQSKGLVPWP